MSRRPASRAGHSQSQSAPTAQIKLRVFLGIFTRVSQYTHRTLMRVTMLAAPPPGLEYRFVVCGTGHSTRTSVANEHDVLQLNVSNQVAGRGFCGKHRGSVELFAAVDALWPQTFDWIAKADYDAWVVLPNLMRVLAPLPPDDGYFGIHCLGGHKRSGVQLVREHSVGDSRAHGDLFFDDRDEELPVWFMCGMLYALTADVARWLRLEAKAPARKIGMTGEDFLLRRWLMAGRRGANAHTCLWAHCYDLPMPNSASQNALPTDHVRQAHPTNRTLESEKRTFARHRELNRDARSPDRGAGTAATDAAVVDAEGGHLGESARVAAWKRYGPRMLSETVVVHNIKTTSEWLSISAHFERYRAQIMQTAQWELQRGAGRGRDRVGGSGSDAGATGSSTSWTLPMQPFSAVAMARFYKLLGFPAPPPPPTSDPARD
jgi:hypothetical protein